MKNLSLQYETAPNGVVSFGAFDYFYTDPRLALWELKQRRKDDELKKAVRSDLNHASESVTKKFTKPRAVLFRQLGTPTHEVLRFLGMAKKLKLEPLILEYYGDKFVSTENRYKRSLGKMPIYQHTGSDGRDMVQYNTICDFNSWVGKNIGDVICKDGESLTNFHHRLLREIGKINPKTHCVDATEWFESVGNKAGNYYEHFLKLFVRDGILFENYLTTRSEWPFVRTSVAPAFAHIEKEYGYKPLVVRLLPQTEELRLFWDAFPKKTKRIMERLS